MGPFADGWTINDVEAVIARGDPADLLFVPIVVSLDPPDCTWSEAICTRLSSHADAKVRGNAVLGFGHPARTCGKLNENIVRPIIEAALRDAAVHVYEQAVAAADDVEHYLKWRIKR